MKSAGLLVSVIPFTVLAAGSATIEAPVAGIVYNTKDNGWLTYECNRPDDENLTCDFVQVRFRQKLKAEEVEAQFQKEMAQEPSLLKTPAAAIASKEFQGLCETIPQSLEYFRSGTLPKGANPDFPPQRFSAQQRQEMVGHYTLVQQACEQKDGALMAKALRGLVEMRSRTCEVVTNPFHQEFAPVRDMDGRLSAWRVKETAPQGECGFVQYSRFRPTIDSTGKPSDFMWDYIAKRVTSNPEGKPILGNCTDWDESETYYTPYAQNIPLQCDFLEPSVL